MSRQIDVSNPESLSDEDRQYLADRGRTVDEERQAQEERNRVAETIEYDADATGARLEYLRRNGGSAIGDPNLGRLRKARQI